MLYIFSHYQSFNTNCDQKEHSCGVAVTCEGVSSQLVDSSGVNTDTHTKIPHNVLTTKEPKNAIIASQYVDSFWSSYQWKVQVEAKNQDMDRRKRWKKSSCK